MVDKFKWSAHKNEIRDYDSDVTVGDLDEYYASIVSSISGFQVIDSAAPPGQKYRTGPLMSETGGPRTMKFCNDFETMDRESGEEINPFGRDPLALSFAATDPSGIPIASTNEGDVFAFKLLAGNAFEGEEFDYTITGVSSIDFTPGSAPLTGTFVTTDSETALIYLQSIANDTIESEIINITLDDFPEATLDLPLIDVISNVDDWEPVQAGPFNEGDTFNMIVNGTSLDATLYWEIDEPDAASNYDVTSGTFATDGSTGTTQAITILEDEKTEAGNLPDNIILKDSALGTELGSYPFVYNDTSTSTYSVFTASEVGFVPNASNKALWPRGLAGEPNLEANFNLVKAAQGYIDSSYDEVADSANDPVNFTRFYVFYSGAVDSNEDFSLTSSRQHRLLFGTSDIEAVNNPSGGGLIIVPTDTYFNPGSIESIDPKRWYKNTFESPFGLSWCDVRFVKDNLTEGNIPFSAWYRQSRQNNQGVYIYQTKAAFRGMVANDTSQTPSYSVTGTRNINESTTGQDGNNVGAGIWRYTVNTQNIEDGTTVYWNLSLDSAVPPTTDTHLPLQFEELSGSTTITGNTGTFDIVTTDSAGELTTEIDKDYMLRIHNTANFNEPALTGDEVVTGGKVFQPITVIDTLKNPIHASATVGMQGVKTIVYNRNATPDGSFGGRFVVLRIGNGWWQLGEQVSPFYPNDFGHLYTLNDDFWAGQAYNGTPPIDPTYGSVDLDYLTYLDGPAGNQEAIDLAAANPLSAHSTATVGNVVALPPIDVANSTSTLRLYEKQPFLFPSASWAKENSQYFVVGLRNASSIRSTVPPNLQVFANYYSDGYGQYFQNTYMYPNQETTHGYHKNSSALKGQPSGVTTPLSKAYADRFSEGIPITLNSNPDKKYANTGGSSFSNRPNAYLGLDFTDDNSYHEFKFRHLIYDAGPGSPNSVTGGSFWQQQYSVHHFWLNVRSWEPKFGVQPGFSYGNPNLTEIGEELFSTRINILIDGAFNNFPKPT